MQYLIIFQILYFILAFSILKNNQKLNFFLKEKMKKKLLLLGPKMFKIECSSIIFCFINSVQSANWKSKLIINIFFSFLEELVWYFFVLLTYQQSFSHLKNDLANKLYLKYWNILSVINRIISFRCPLPTAARIVFLIWVNEPNFNSCS